MQASYPFVPHVNPELDNMATKAYAAKAKSGTPLACSLDSFRTKIHTLHYRLPKSPKQSDLDALASELSSNKPLPGKENGKVEKENVKAGTNSGGGAVGSGANVGIVGGGASSGVGGGGGVGGKKEVDQAVMQVLHKYFGFDCGVESRRGSPDLS